MSRNEVQWNVSESNRPHGLLVHLTVIASLRYTIPIYFYNHMQTTLRRYIISMKPNPITLAFSLFHVNPLQNHEIISIIMHINAVVIIFKVFISHLRHIID